MLVNSIEKERNQLIYEIEHSPKSYELLINWREVMGYKSLCLTRMTIFQLRLFKYYLEEEK